MKRRPLFLKNWFIDRDSAYRFVYNKFKKHVCSQTTQFQQVDIIDTQNLGRVVILDKKVQSAELDEFIYHEALVHPAMITHPNPKSILILGGGEGATLREVLKHETVQKVVMVDIDQEFVDLCKRYLRKWHRGSFKNKKVEILFQDAFDYMRKTECMFDIIIADISDPIDEGPALKIYTKEFYSLVKKVLSPRGIFVTHATEVHYAMYKKTAENIVRIIRNIFPIAKLYFEYIPSFICLWGFAIASAKYNPKTISSSTIENRLQRRKVKDLLYYNALVHKRMFTLPGCLKKFLNIA
jgi:spermidine synthase